MPKKSITKSELVCAVFGCGRSPVVARRLCSRCYQKWKKGTLQAKEEFHKLVSYSGKLCIDCKESDAVSKRRCNSCYKKWRYRTVKEVRERFKANARIHREKRTDEDRKEANARIRARRKKEVEVYGHRLDYIRLKQDPVRKAAFLKKQRDQRRDLRLQALKRYGNRCVCCHETEEAFLAFDHIKGDGSIERLAIFGSNFYRSLVRDKKRNDIQILCHNCNMATRRGTCPHQKQ